MSRVNDKRSFNDNPYLFLTTRFVYNYTYYQAISVTIFCKKTVYQTLLSHQWMQYDHKKAYGPLLLQTFLTFSQLKVNCNV